MYARERFLELVAQQVSWTHFTKLVSAPTDKKRKEWERKTIKERLTVRDLQQLMTQACGNRREGSGCKIALPRDVPHALDRTQRAVTQCGNLLDVVFGDEFNLCRNAKDIPSDDWSEKLFEQLESTRKSLADLSRQAHDGECLLEEAIKRGQEVMAKRQEDEASTASDQDEPESEKTTESDDHVNTNVGDNPSPRSSNGRTAGKRARPAAARLATNKA